MTKSTMEVLLEDVIEVVFRYVEDEEQRYNIYEDLIESFLSAGVENFIDALGFDPIFDMTLEEQYPGLYGDPIR